LSLSSLYEYLQLLNANQRAFFHSHYTLKEKEKKKDMLLLYKVLLKQKKLDEKAVKKVFKNKNLARLVRRLFEIIEDYMLLFDKKMDKYSEIFNLVVKAKKQRAIGLLDRAEFLLLKAKKLTEEVEDANYLTIILKELSEIYIINYDFDTLSNIQKLFNSNLEQVTKELNLYFSLVNMRIKLRQVVTNNLNTDKLDVFTPKELDILSLSESELNSECLEQQLYINNVYYALLKDNKKAYKYQLKSIDFYEAKGVKNRLLTYINFTRYALLIYNKFHSEMRNNNFEEAEQTFFKFMNLEKEKNYFTNARAIGLYKIRKSNIQLYYYLAIKNFSKIIELEKENLDTIKNFSHLVPLANIFTIQYFTGFSYFTQKNYNNASDYFKELIDNKKIKQRKDIESVSQIKYLICIYELDGGLFAKSILNSCNRIIKQNHPNVRTYFLVIELIGKLLKPLITKFEEAKLKSSYLKIFNTLCKKVKFEADKFEELGLIYWLK